MATKLASSGVGASIGIVILGGASWMIIGPIGVVIGGIAGALIGNEAEYQIVNQTDLLEGIYDTSVLESPEIDIDDISSTNQALRRELQRSQENLRRHIEAYETALQEVDTAEPTQRPIILLKAKQEAIQAAHESENYRELMKALAVSQKLETLWEKDKQAAKEISRDVYGLPVEEAIQKEPSELAEITKGFPEEYEDILEATSRSLAEQMDEVIEGVNSISSVLESAGLENLQQMELNQFSHPDIDIQDLVDEEELRKSFDDFESESG